MSENIAGGTNVKYLTQIPEYSEDADIQTALRLYHYGQDKDNFGAGEEPAAQSIAGHLGSLESSKLSRTPQTIGASANLNSYISTGYFVQPSSTNAQTGTNYPSENNQFFSGLLKVVNSGSLVFQEYHILGESLNIINRVYRRVFFNSWSSWEKSISANDVVAITDPRYYLRADVFTKTQANDAFAPKYFRETSLKTSNYTLVLEDLNRIVAMNVPTGGILTIPTNAAVAFPSGSIINVYNASPIAFLEIKGADGVTLRNPGTIEPYQEASLRKRDTNEWVAAGPVY